jgi:hypothetical protein
MRKHTVTSRSHDTASALVTAMTLTLAVACNLSERPMIRRFKRPPS